MRPLIYLAHPYSSQPELNAKASLTWFSTFMRMDVDIFNPLLSYWHDVNSNEQNRLSYDEWLNYDLRIISRCDALFRVPGHSPGADVEVAHAKRLGLPVMTTLEGVRKFVDDYKWDFSRQIEETRT